MSPQQSAAIAIFVMAYGPDALYAMEAYRVNDMVADIRDNPGVRYRTYLKAAQRVHPFFGGRVDAFRALQQAKSTLEVHGVVFELQSAAGDRASMLTA